MPRLATFIRENYEPILAEWEHFARTFPAAESMDITALRDHAREMLGVIALDLETSQTPEQQSYKSRGRSDAAKDAPLTAAQEHGAGRAQSGFTVAQMVSEFRALRASVIRLWLKEAREVLSTDLEDMIRFNEAIDQAIAESITRYTTDVGQSKERFLAILGHDLRTPLSAIMMSTGFMLDAAREKGLEEPYLSLASRAASSARRMNHMVADLLEFARTRFGGSIPIERGDVDAARVVRDAVSEVLASYPSSSIEVETSGEVRGQWDADRLTQAVTNLMVNAVQHGAERSPVKIAVRSSPKEIIISVHNAGAAIPARRLRTIFDSGNLRGDASSAHDRRHLGLGLYIVERIVVAHGGSIDVRSSDSEGTTFSMHLPRSA